MSENRTERKNAGKKRSDSSNKNKETSRTVKRFPAWNYWHFDQDGNWRRDLDERLDWGEDDLRSARFRSDDDRWAREPYWNAEEAAALSFAREPNKIYWDWDGDYSDSVTMELEDMEESETLRSWIQALCGLIKEAQTKDLLPPFFRPPMYFNWAERMDVDVNSFLQDKVAAVEKKQQGQRRTDASNLKSQPDEASTLVKTKKHGQRRLENNMRRLILALLEKGRWRADTLSKDLSEILDNLAEHHENDDLKLGKQTIEKRLTEARLLVQPRGMSANNRR